MNKAPQYLNQSFSKPVFWLVFALYLFVSAFAMAHHEPWGDEIHSWNIAKASTGFFDLLHNIRYEGHPPVWYIILWTISKFTHNLAFVQAAHFLIAGLSVFLILFYSPLPFISKLLLPFGYYFLFEYSVLSRNYAIGILFTMCICVVMTKNFRYRTLLYYSLLFLLSNTHLLGMLMAASLHVYFLWVYQQNNNRNRILNIHSLIGLLIIVTGVYFIFPPGDSELNVQFWLNRWGTRNFINFGQAPLRAFIPISSWWKYNFWNSEFIIDVSRGNNVILFIGIVLSVLIMIVLVLSLRKNKSSQVLFGSHLLFSFIVAMTFFTLGSARYAGFLFIAYIAAYWLYYYKIAPGRKNQIILNAFLLIQLCGSAQPIINDIRHPFSNAYRVKEILSKVPENEKMVTDYWALNAIAAFADKPFYCIDLQKEVAFLKWDGEFKSKIFKPARFTDGVNNYFQKESVSRLYLISTVSPVILNRVDEKLSLTFNVKLVDKIEGAIEADSNLYLYEISKPDSQGYH